MGRYVARRIAHLVPTLFGVSVLIFLLVRLLPGDVLDALGGDQAGAPGGARDALRHQLGLDAPLPVQYMRWIRGLLTGHPGTSMRSGAPLSQLIGHALPITVELVVIGVVIALVVGVPLGVLSAAAPGRASDYLARGVGMIGVSLPSFWLATLLLLATSSLLHWTPSSTYIDPLHDPLGNLREMLLPGLCVGLYLMAMVMRMLRATMLEVLGEDYVRTARAKGVPSRDVVVRHGLRNALLPVITVTAFEVGVLLSGTALVEAVFGLPGLGNLLVQGIFDRDYTVIQAVTLLMATAFVVLNLLADLLYAVVDPRVQVR